jgi:hypothetical protein
MASTVFNRTNTIHRTLSVSQILNIFCIMLKNRASFVICVRDGILLACGSTLTWPDNFTKRWCLILLLFFYWKENEPLSLSLSLSFQSSSMYGIWRFQPTYSNYSISYNTTINIRAIYSNSVYDLKTVNYRKHNQLDKQNKEIKLERMQ